MSIKEEIEAVKFLLGSYFDSPTVDQRMGLIKTQYEETKNKYLRTYSEFTVENLKRQLFILEDQSTVAAGGASGAGFFGLLSHFFGVISGIAFWHPLPVVQLTVSVADLPCIPVSPNGCKNPVGADETVTWIYEYLNRSIWTMTTDSLRKSPILISRCARGGKTTILNMVYKKIKQDQQQVPKWSVMTISFNGVAGFERLTDETPTQSLFRLITNQLDIKIHRQSPRVTDWDLLDDHIGDEPFVLLIDELNVLCNPVNSDLSSVLKKYFLDKANRHLVITSHQPFLGEKGPAEDENAVRKSGLWSDSVSALSDRPLVLVSMPFSSNPVLLVKMDSSKCSGINHSFAAYYGYMPSLMYAVCIQQEESPANKFDMVTMDFPRDPLLGDFVMALITGIPVPSLKRYFCFTSAVESETAALGIRIKWPLCYVACIFRFISRSKDPRAALAWSMAECIDSLRVFCEIEGDGKVWEESVRIAILSRFVAAAEGYDFIPFGLCSKDEAENADIKLMRLGSAVKTVEDVKTVIFDKAGQFSKNTLVLFAPGHSTLHQFDGFCVRYQDRKVCNACGYQCKDSNKGAKGEVQDWMSGGGHLLRSNAPKKCMTDGPNNEGWTYYNGENTDDFLGWSLRVMRKRRFTKNP